MKHLKVGLRIWIALCSLAGFLTGWAMLAHSPKPAPAAQTASLEQPVQLPALPPMPSFSQTGSNFQPLPLQPQTSFAMPRLRTGGS